MHLPDTVFVQKNSKILGVLKDVVNGFGSFEPNFIGGLDTFSVDRKIGPF